MRGVATRIALPVALGVALSGALCAAQAQGTGVTVVGVAYDSLRREPLPSAFIVLGGTRSTMTDARGHFEFDAVAPGVHRLDMQHALLDSMGLPGVSTLVSVTDGRDRLTIAIPSFATLWRAACGESRPPRDSGFVYGTVRDARDESVVPGAAIEISWSDWSTVPFGTEAQRISQRRWWSESQADSRGEYGLCGIPVGTAVRLQAGTDSTVSGLIDMITTLRVMRRDLLLGPTATTEPILYGVVEGTISDASGAPFAGAGIVVDDVPRLRTGPDGRFVLRDVPIGTRQLEVIAIGVRPVVLAVDVVATQVASVAATLTRITTLDVVRIIGSPWQRRFANEFAERRRLRTGYVFDSTTIERRPTMTSLFSTVPSAVVRLARGGQFVVTLPSLRGDRCSASVWLDGWRSTYEELAALRPNDLAAIEVFPRASQVPLRFSGPGGCGAVVVWTKWAFR